MKTTKPLIAAIIAVALGVTLNGCGKLPQEDIDATQAAVERAKLSEADLYAPKAFQEAEDALSSAMTEVDAQRVRFAPFRSFDQAKKLLLNAKKEAEEAAAEGEAGKEEVRREVESLIRDTEKSMLDAKAALETAPRGKGTGPEIEAMKAELEVLGVTLTEVHQAYEAGNYLGAKAKVQALRDKAGAIAADIAQAKAKRRA